MLPTVWPFARSAEEGACLFDILSNATRTPGRPGAQLSSAFPNNRSGDLLRSTGAPPTRPLPECRQLRNSDQRDLPPKSKLVAVCWILVRRSLRTLLRTRSNFIMPKI